MCSSDLALHKALGVPDSPGLVEIFTSDVPFQNAVISKLHPNLSFIPRGKSHDLKRSFYINPAQWLQLKAWARDYDYVVFDSPPVFAGADAVTLAPQMDGVFMVVRRRHSRAGVVTHALEMLYQRRAKVLGFVFNRADAASDVYYGYGYKYYNARIRSSESKASRA